METHIYDPSLMQIRTTKNSRMFSSYYTHAKYWQAAWQPANINPRSHLASNWLISPFRGEEFSCRSDSEPNSHLGLNPRTLGLLTTRPLSAYEFCSRTEQQLSCYLSRRYILINGWRPVKRPHLRRLSLLTQQAIVELSCVLKPMNKQSTIVPATLRLFPPKTGHK